MTDKRSEIWIDRQTDKLSEIWTDRRYSSLNVESYDGTLIVECLVDDGFEAAGGHHNHLAKPLQGTSRQRLLDL